MLEELLVKLTEEVKQHGEVRIRSFGNGIERSRFDMEAFEDYHVLNQMKVSTEAYLKLLNKTAEKK